MVSRAEPGFELGAYEGRFTAPSGGSEGQEYLNGTFRRIDEHVKKKVHRRSASEPPNLPLPIERRVHRDSCMRRE